MTVERFERDGSGGTQLVAIWIIRDGSSDRTLLARQSNFSVSAATQSDTAGASATAAGSSNSSIDSGAAALSIDLGDLSKQIADAIIELNSSRATRITD